MNRRTLMILALALSLLLPCMNAGSESASDSLYVKKVENLPEDFIFGMDVSTVLAEEASGVRYYGFDGSETDLFRILADCGINYIRVRLWNDPYDRKGNGFGGGNCDIGTVTEIGKRAAACGMKLLVDFHYSDFWADPGKQMVPRAWKSMNVTQKTKALYEYTRSSLIQLKEAGVDVGMVQIGNETTTGMCGETIWKNVARLMDAGARAVREVFPDALVALHFTDPQNADQLRYIAGELNQYEQQGLIGYDVFATSYYPFWHGTLENLSRILTEISETYGKKVMVAETSYPYTTEDSDFSGNTVNADTWPERTYPYSVQGQANCIRDITDTLVNGTPSGIGIFYWEGAWITVGTDSWEENHEKWEKDGSGWATSYAVVYDPKDAGQYYGGSAWDNQAFFDPEGKPLESLKVFRLMREGNETEIRIVSVTEPQVICELGKSLELPGIVEAVMTDGSRREIPVSWKLTGDLIARMHSSGAGEYTVTGVAEGLDVICHISMRDSNYLKDYSFEEDSGAWVLTDLKKTQELYIEDKPGDSLTGNKHAHFWSPEKNSVEFTLEQTVADLPAGRYSFSVSVMGGDCGETDIYAYVKENGEIIARSEQIPVTGWPNWNAGIIPEFEHAAGSEITVGVYVRCQGEGKGAWGKIDDAALSSVH